MVDQWDARLLAADIQGATDKMNWRTTQTNLRVHDIHSIMLKYMYEKRVNELVAVFKRFGYLIHDNNAQQAQGLIVPQRLYEEARFALLLRH